MIRAAFLPPQLQVWQNRLARLPKWAWLAIGIGVLVPLSLVLLTFLAAAAVSAFLVFAVVGLVLAVRNSLRRLAAPRNVRDLHHPGARGPFRENVRPVNRLVVHSRYEVIDQP